MASKKENYKDKAFADFLNDFGKSSTTNNQIDKAAHSVSESIEVETPTPKTDTQVIKPEKIDASLNVAPVPADSDGWENIVTKKQTYNKHINLMVQSYTREKLDEYSKADNKSRNELINMILKDYISKRG